MPSEGAIPPARSTVPSMPAVRPSQMSLPAVRPSQMSLPAVRSDDASEAELPTHDGAPPSQPIPASGPRSVRGAPISVRAAPISVRQPAPLANGISARVDDSPPSVRAPAGPKERIGFQRETSSPVSEVAEVIRSRFRAPGLLLAVAIGITLIDLAMVRISGEPLSVGPVRALWIAGPLAVIGAVLLVWKIVGDD